MPNSSSCSGEAGQMPTPLSSKRGLGREAGAALLRVRTGPECPKGNLRELTSDSKPDPEIAIEVKSPKIRHCQARSQKKGLSRANQLWTGPSPARERGVRAVRAGRGQSQPQRGIIYQTASRFHC